MIDIRVLSPDSPPEHFPDPLTALDEPNGLIAAGGDLSPERLLYAYGRGIFPWYEADQPILWWSPDPRAVFLPGGIKVSRSLRKTLRSGRFRCSYDVDFAAVIDACAEPRDESWGTWITADMREAYLTLHRQGHAHSVECWQGDELAGGLYGVALGRMFFGESMFTRVSNASKVALWALSEWLGAWNYALIDCQMPTEHLARLGAQHMPRAQFIDSVSEFAQRAPAPDAWRPGVADNVPPGR
ncbi:MAG: leucyl/phenylalanyl-tRNA--protein transferase [Pseudomonadota bacterium]